jgi:alpha/beta superfamily hydrolase
MMTDHPPLPPLTTQTLAMFKEIIRKYFAKSIYPTYPGDWYKRKGYIGDSHLDRFNDFVNQQKQPGAIYYQEFRSLKLTRELIISGHCKIDSVTIKPSKALSDNKPGEGLYIICFQGRGEYYESRFRDMAMLARETGATVIGFNPKGFHASSGKTRVLSDIVDDGIALIEHLLAQNVASSQIILYGNSLGGWVQEMICGYFRKLKSIDFRQINSNSFRSLAAVVSSNLGVGFLEKKLSNLMKYVGWEITPGKDFYKTGIYRCYLTRENDKTIKPDAAFCAKINSSKDILEAPAAYKDSLKWLNDNANLVCLTETKKDPHDLSLYNFHLKAQDEKGKNLTVWYFINKYLKASNGFVRKG